MRRVLIVEDDPGILGAMTMILEDSGYLIETAMSEDEVYPKIDHFKPDLIILDILLSGSDGREICKKIRQNSDTKNIPIVISSAHPNAEEFTVKCHANDFLAKPFTLDGLILKVKKYAG